MTFIIPPQDTKAIKQPNSSDLAGSIFVTKNIDLDKEGYIKLSPPSFAVMTTDNDADFSTCDSLFISDGNVFFNSTKVFNSISNVDWNTFNNRETDTGVPSPSVEEDGVFFNDTEVISDGSSIYYRSASTTWTSVALSLNTGVPTQMYVFDGANGLMVGNNNIVKLVNTSWSVAVTLTLPNDFLVTGVCANGTKGYVATRHKGNGEAKLFVWDGTSTSADEAYGVKTFEIASIVPYGSSVAVVTSLGQLLRFNGGGFDVLANFPIYYSDEEWADASNDHSNCSFKGMAVDGENIYLRIDSENQSKSAPYDPYFVGGVWCYDPKVGLYHKTSPSYSRITRNTVTTANVDTTSNEITVTTAPSTGTIVLYDNFGGTAIPELIEGKVYYAINVSGTVFKLAETLALAQAGTAIDLTGTGNNSQRFLFYIYNDYGWSYAGNRGAIGVMTSNLFDEFYSGRIVYTADLFSKQNVATSKTVACVQVKQLPNVGYFITPRLSSPRIEDKFPKIFLKTKPLDVDDEIVVKYKVRDKVNYPVKPFSRTKTTWTGTWSDTNTFTTTMDLSNVVAGEEVEIIAGVGAGWVSQIDSISESSGTYTVNLVDSFPTAVANDVMFFVVDNWSVLTTIDSDTKTNARGYFELPISEEGTFIQFKIVLKGKEITIIELQVPNSEHRSVV